VEQYATFLKQIPEGIMKEIECYYATEVALFKPDTFITGKTLESADYHVIIPRMVSSSQAKRTRQW